MKMVVVSFFCCTSIVEVPVTCPLFLSGLERERRKGETKWKQKKKTLQHRMTLTVSHR